MVLGVLPILIGLLLHIRATSGMAVDLHWGGRTFVLVMLLVAIPFVLTLRRESSLGQRIVVGVTFGLGFYLFDRTFGHFGLIYEINPILAACLPTVLVFLGASVAIARSR